MRYKGEGRTEHKAGALNKVEYEPSALCLLIEVDFQQICRLLQVEEGLGEKR